MQKVKRQLKRQKDNIKKIAKFSVEEYCNITDQMLPPVTANFVKTQIHLSHKLPKGRKYSDEFKKFCLSLPWWIQNL